MAVFTPVSLEELRVWMRSFSLGSALSIRGIESGIENSNFFISTDMGEYVLTIFENLTATELRYYLELMRHLANKGAPVPLPFANNDGDIISTLHDKPAAIVAKLNGCSLVEPSAPHCFLVGAALAKLHLAGADFGMSQPNLRGLLWWQQTVPSVLPFLDEDKKTLLSEELDAQVAFAENEEYGHLPRGPVHADLFRNNVMFDGDELSGFFDFYFAGDDTWIFDVAVTVNDWCIDHSTGKFNEFQLSAFLSGYQSVRAFRDIEKNAWSLTLRAAALRFWLSRLYDFYLPRSAEMLTPHDPAHFERILRQRILYTPSLS